MKNIRVGILTISDKGSRGEREDKSGFLLKGLVEFEGALVSEYKIIPDEAELIEFVLKEWVDIKKLQIILTSGGTGLSERDVTPEATANVIQKNAPGFSESIRQQNLAKTKRAMLSRGISGVRRRTLIINLPGNPKAVNESFQIIKPVLAHAVQILEGNTEH